MEVIIDHDKTKREIRGPFNICGSKEDLELIARTILARIEDRGYFYGWVDILVTNKQEHFANTIPESWD